MPRVAIRFMKRIFSFLIEIRSLVFEKCVYWLSETVKNKMAISMSRSLLKLKEAVYRKSPLYRPSSFFTNLIYSLQARLPLWTHCFPLKSEIGHTCHIRQLASEVSFSPSIDWRTTTCSDIFVLHHCDFFAIFPFSDPLRLWNLWILDIDWPRQEDAYNSASVMELKGIQKRSLTTLFVCRQRGRSWAKLDFCFRFGIHNRY